MTTPRKTHSQTLVELAFPGDITQYVVDQRTAGEPWRTITEQVNSRLDHGVKVSWESLRTWYGTTTA